ncbi:hypothetical protein LSPH26S_02238 [Lysinibacillus sphaericus]
MVATTPPPIHAPIVKPTKIIMTMAGSARRIPLYIISSISIHLKPCFLATIAATIVPTISGTCGLCSNITTVTSIVVIIIAKVRSAQLALISFFIVPSPFFAPNYKFAFHQCKYIFTIFSLIFKKYKVNAKILCFYSNSEY